MKEFLSCFVREVDDMEMKDSGIEWVGKIPSDWDIYKINGLYSIRNTKVSDEEYPPLSVTMKGILPQLESAAKSDDHNNRKLVKKGDFAINSRSDRRGACGISEYDGSVSLINTVLKPNRVMCNRYYNWLFHTVQFADEFYRWGHGIVNDLWTTGWQEMKRMSVPFPAIDIQERIASFLDEKCAEIDRLISDIQKQIETLERYKKSVITETVIKGINLNVEIKDSGIEWIGQITKEWKIIRFKYVAEIKSRLVNPEKYMDCFQIGPDSIEKDTGRLLFDRTVEESGILSGNQIFYKGQIIYSKIRPSLNKVIIAPYDGLCSADMYPIDTKQNIDYIKYMMLSDVFNKQVRLITQDRVKMPKINQDELYNIFIILPPIKEQEQISIYLNEKCVVVDETIALKRQQLETLVKYKESLIYEYVTGKKEVV